MDVLETVCSLTGAFVYQFSLSLIDHLQTNNYSSGARVLFIQSLIEWEGIWIVCKLNLLNLKYCVNDSIYIVSYEINRGVSNK